MKNRGLCLVAFLMALALPAMAQVNGTNAVDLLADNLNNASSITWPIVVGIIAALGCLGVFLKFGRRAGFRG